MGILFPEFCIFIAIFRKINFPYIYARHDLEMRNSSLHCSSHFIIDFYAVEVYFYYIKVYHML